LSNEHAHNVIPDWLTPDLHAELKAHPEQLDDCDQLFLFFILHSEWMVINGELQLVIPADETDIWIEMLRPVRDAPVQWTHLAAVQATFRETIAQAIHSYEQQRDSEGE
jgi:hypothetical protein